MWSYILDVLRNVFHLTKLQPTLPVEEVPLLFREPGVKSGYRPTKKDPTYYVKSAFQVNNETVNVWTHAIGFCIILLKTLSYLPFYLDRDPRYWPMLGFGVCSLIFLALSTFAHAVHSASPLMHYLCFQIDYAGVAQFTLGGSLLMSYLQVSEEIVTSYFPYWVFPVNILLSFNDFLCCTIAKLKYRRPYPFARKLWQVIPLTTHASFSVFVLMGPRFFKCFRSPSCHMFWEEPGLAFVFLASIAGIICAVFFSSHIPEKIWPGKFDFIGQGHQIFHVSSVILVIFQFQAAELDIVYHHRVNMTHLPCWQIPVSICLLLSVCCFTIYVLFPYTLRRAKEEE
nr:membrane progestin receptor beta [Physella acuta]